MSMPSVEIKLGLKKIKIRKNIRYFLILAVIGFFIVVVGVAILMRRSRMMDSMSNLSLNKDVVILDKPVLDSSISLEETLAKRHSSRRFKNEPLSFSEVSQILWAAQGMIGRKGGRTVPSAGGLYPIKVYVAIGKVSGVTPGVYRYEPDKHVLEKVFEGDVRSRLRNASLFQVWVGNGAMVLVMTADFSKTTGRYGERGVRYVQMEVGHAAQNVYLQAEALGLGSVFVGAFDDSKVKEIMQMEEDEEPLGIMPVGKKR